jgi:hypothetical protein
MIQIIVMRKIVLIFIIAWVVFCLISTGSQVIPPKWREILKQDPDIVQDFAGDAFNQGARAVKASGLPKDGVVTFFAEYDGLKSLSLTYWLYPTRLQATRANSIREIFARPETDTIYFVGKRTTYDQNFGFIPTNYYTQIIRQVDSQVFAVVAKK